MIKLGKLSSALTVFRGGQADSSAPAGLPTPWLPPVPVATPWVPGPAEERPRLVFGLDATASRSVTLRAAQRLTDSILTALPGSLDVNLAVHGGGRLHTFTHFTADVAQLRDMTSSLTCRAGGTRLLDILKRALKTRAVKVVLYIGDCFEESEADARRIADALCHRHIRVVILHEGPPPAAFGEIAERSGGALLPFDTSAIDALADLCGAVAVLAVGDVEALETIAPVKPEARLLLETLSDRKLISRRPTC